MKPKNKKKLYKLSNNSSLQIELKNGIVVIKDDCTKTTSELLKAVGCPYWSFWNDLLDTDFPIPKKTTRRKFKWIQEADPEHKNKSANDCEKDGLQGIKLRERLIFEKLWFDKMGTHLDVKNITLCTGSRSSDGGVPGVHWDGGRMRVGWDSPSGQGDDLRSRVAV